MTDDTKRPNTWDRCKLQPGTPFKVYSPPPVTIYGEDGLAILCDLVRGAWARGCDFQIDANIIVFTRNKVER